MRTKTFYFSVIAAGAMIILASCGGSKKAASTSPSSPPPVGEVEIKSYCTGDQYKTTKETFRASGIGESMDQSTSKKKAIMNAQTELATLLQTTIKSVTDNYTKSSTGNMTEELGQKYEQLTRAVVNQVLSNLVVACEKQTMTTNKNYKTYVCLEIGATDFLGAVNSKLSADAELKIDYNYEKFKNTYNEEMSKLGEARK